MTITMFGRVRMRLSALSTKKNVGTKAATSHSLSFCKKLQLITYLAKWMDGILNKDDYLQHSINIEPTDCSSKTRILNTSKFILEWIKQANNKLLDSWDQNYAETKKKYI